MSDTLGKRLKKAREIIKKTQNDVCKMLGISIGTLSGYERDYRKPDADMIKKFSEIYDVSTDYLLGREMKENKTTYDSTLTPKEERTIEKELERLLADLESDHALAFDGEPSAEDKELMRSALEHSLRTARIIAKKKFTPKKYKK